MPGPTPRIIIGVDFGTTCSSVAYVYTKTFHPETNLLERWPGTFESAGWVPSTIKHKPDRWGYEIDKEDEDQPRYEWFKLGLAPLGLFKSSLMEQYPSRTALEYEVGEECEGLVTEYLRNLRKHAENYIKQKLTEIVWKNNGPPHYIITVPAVWDPKAWNTTQKCAESAGMGKDVQIITEPEAAGIYALKSIAQPLKVNDTFVMCDAGGGTVDLISYTVSGVGKNLTIEETAPGTGDLCGSTFLNRIFEEKLLSKFRGAHRHTQLAEWRKDYHAAAMRKFETTAKREFEGDLNEDFKFPARNMKPNDDIGIRGGNLTITGREMHEIFEHVIPKIISLVRAQIKETQKAGKHVQKILLAGGFGESLPTAIVRGAILRAMAEKSPEIKGVLNVGGRYSKCNIGALAWVKYDTTDHADCPLGKTEDDDFKGGKRVEVMDWLIRKGDLVRESDPTPYPFHWERRTSRGRPQNVKIALYKCDDKTPKYRISDIQVPKFVDLKAELSKIPDSKFDVVAGADGKEYFQIDLVVAIACRSGSFKFTLMHKGEPYDTFEQTMN